MRSQTVAGILFGTVLASHMRGASAIPVGYEQLYLLSVITSLCSDGVICSVLTDPGDLVIKCIYLHVAQKYRLEPGFVVCCIWAYTS